MITYNNIINRFEKFVDEHHFLQTFSHGSPDAVDLDKFEVYPLLHLVYTGSTYDSTSKEYSFEVYILDLPADKADKLDNQKQLVSNAEQAAEDLLADLRNGGNVFDFGSLYTLTNASSTPLEETQSNSLSGILLTIGIEVGYEYDSCNAPLSGVTPGGSASESVSGRQSTITAEFTRTVSIPSGPVTKIIPISHTSWTSYSYNLNGSASFQNNYLLFRQEVHGLNTLTNVRFDFTCTLTADAAGVFIITTDNTGFNLGLSDTQTFTEAGTRELSFSCNADSIATDYLFNTLQVQATTTGTFIWRSFTYTITDPTSA